MTEFVPGVTPTWLELSADEIVAAIELQADVAPAPTTRPAGATWSDYARSVVRAGSEQMEALQAAGDACRWFMSRVASEAAALDRIHLPRVDAVHGDLVLENLLIAERRIHIIDIDACGPGTRALDYAWLLCDATSHAAPREFCDEVYRAGVNVAGADAFRFSLVVACLEIVAFVVHHGTAADVDRAVERASLVLDRRR